MNTVGENNFFWISQGKVHGYSIQVRWANVQAIGVIFSQYLITHQKSLKSVDF